MLENALDKFDIECGECACTVFTSVRHEEVPNDVIAFFLGVKRYYFVFHDIRDTVFADEIVDGTKMLPIKRHSVKGEIQGAELGPRFKTGKIGHEIDID